MMLWVFCEAVRSKNISNFSCENENKFPHFKLKLLISSSISIKHISLLPVNITRFQDSESFLIEWTCTFIMKSRKMDIHKIYLQHVVLYKSKVDDILEWQLKCLQNA